MHLLGALLVQQVGRAHGFEGPRRKGEGPLLSEGAAKLIYAAVEGRLLQVLHNCCCCCFCCCGCCCCYCWFVCCCCCTCVAAAAGA